MKSFLTVCTAAFALGAFVTGCGSAPATRSQFTNYETPGNLESTQSIGCESVSNLRNTHTPPDLYNGMVECVNQGNYSSAVYLFALAGTYSYYDGLRVADSTARQAHSVLLQNSLNSLDNAKKNALWQELQKTLGSRDKLSAICIEIVRIGGPQYYPRYMIQHGMNAVLGNKSGDGLVKNLDSGAAWKKALSGYLHCSNL